MGIRVLPAALLSLCCAFPVWAQTQTPSYGLQLEGFNYAWPARHFTFTSQGQTLEMAYLDIRPEKANGQVAVLMHGKNFCSDTWEGTIRLLSAQGYRVIAPDQIGFCKSSKPAAYQFSFQQLAENTHQLLNHLGITRFRLMGHSTGGMLATRFALMYPESVSQLILVDPVGLEDLKRKGVPYRTIDQWYQKELKTTAASIRKYEQHTYYAGEWKPAWDKWVNMLAGMYNGPGKQRIAWNSAQLYDMIYTQPVMYEWGDLQMPVLLMVGKKDNTAPGKDGAPPAVQATLGNYAVLGKEAASKMPHATLVEFDNLGHAPQIQDPAVFNAALLKGMAAVSGK